MQRSGFIISCSAFLLSLGGMLAAEQTLTRLSFQDSHSQIPLTKNIPVVDGKIQSDWKDFTQWSGFSTFRGERLLQSTRKGFARVCSDGKNLYFGFRTITYNNSPGGGLTRLRSERDGEIYRDDSVELIFNVKNHGYQIIANSLDAVFDMSYAPGGMKNKAWNCAGIKCASSVTDGYWDLEMMIPLSSIGNPEEFRMNIARNWVEHGKINGTTLNSTPAYLNKAFMFRLAPVKNGVYVRETDLGNVDEGQWRYRAEVVNRSPVPVECGILLHHYYDNKSRRDQIRKFMIAPGKTLPVSLDADMNSTVTRNLSILVSDPKSGKRFFARKFAGKFTSMGHRPPTAVFTVKGQGLGQLFHYPGYKRITVEFRPNPGKRYKQVALSVAGQKQTPFRFNRGVWRVMGPAPAVKGKYPVKILFTDLAGKTTDAMIHTLEVRSLPWENNELGNDRIVLPPFNGVTVKDHTIRTLLIKRKLNGLGLYDSVMAEGKELLASPMYFILKVNGKKTVLKSGKPRYVQEKNKYSVVMENTASGADGFRLKVRSTFEYDNFHWMELTLEAPRKVTVEQLTLVIPFREKEAKLLHSLVNEMRESYAGSLPAGKGLVWNGTQLKRAKHRGMQVIHPQILPYLWLGTETTGLSYFIENTVGCKVDHNRNAARIYRENGIVRAELDFINIPVTLKKPRKIQFGLIPTPIKKVSRDMMRFFMDAEGRKLPGMIRCTFFFNYALGFFPEWSMRPFNDDYSFYRKCMHSISSGVPLDFKPHLEQWLKKNGKGFKALYESLPGGAERYKTAPQRYSWFWKHNLQHSARGKSYPMPYTDPRLAFVGDKDVDYYKSEWFNPAVMHYFAAYRTSVTPSYVDFMVYYYDKMLENGVHGIYLDDLFMIPEPNEATMGIRDEEGELHPGNGLLGMREMIRRIVTRMYLRKKLPIILMAHMTCQNIVPVFTHVTSLLGFEQYGGDDSAFPSRFTEDHIRTLYTGTKIGASVHTLRLYRLDPNKYKTRKERDNMWIYLNHTHLAMSLPFNIRSAFTQATEWVKADAVLARFGIADPDSRFVPYWEKGAEALQAKGMLVSSHRKKDRVLVAVSSYYGKKPVTGSLKVDHKALGLPANTPAYDAMTGKKVDLNKLTFQAYGYRLIWLGRFPDSGKNR